MSTTEQGRKAERLAASYLENQNFEILDRNWRTRYCEMDLIALSPSAVHFIEVKYRASDRYGHGFDFVTADKRLRLARAAASWCQQKRYTGAYQIDAISVVGDLEASPTIEWLGNVVGGW